MSWRVSLGFAVTIASSVLIQSAAPVRADEAYLCGPDTVVYVAVAAVAGVLAAVLPARRAARLDVLKALQYE